MSKKFMMSLTFMTQLTPEAKIANADQFHAVAKSLEKEITDLVVAYCEADCIPKSEYKQALKSLFNGNFNRLNSRDVFLIYDAVGCNDTGIRPSIERLEAFYAAISMYWFALIDHEKGLAG